MEIRPVSPLSPLLSALLGEGGPGMGLPGVAAGDHGGSTAALLAGIKSPLAAAGLLADLTPAPAPAQEAAAVAPRLSSAWGLDTPASPLTDGGRLGQAAAGATGLSLTTGAELQAAQPLAPAWITALHSPALRHGPWPDPQAPVRQREQQRRQRGAAQTAEDDAARREADQTASCEPAMRLPRHRGGGLAEAPHDDAPAQAWPAETMQLLPDEVKAELARRRQVLLVAPPGPGQRGLQLVCLGCTLRGQPQRQRYSVRGAEAATTPDTPPRAWQLWRVRREGEDGQRPVLTARPLSPLQPGAAGLVLRITATVLPAPLRPAHHAWLDVLEPQRLWHDLGSQWTLLLAWAPQPLRWDAA